MISGVSGAGGQRGLAEFELRTDLSMCRKIIEILQENERFRGSVVLAGSAVSQNQNLSLGPRYG